MAVVGAAIGYVIAKAMGSMLSPNDTAIAEAKDKSEMLWLLVVLPVSVFWVVFLHESGHALAGIAMGFKFKILTTGPLLIQYTDGQVSLSVNNNLNTAGGITICLPVSAKGIRQKFLFYVLGGPLMSLLLTLFSWLMTIISTHFLADMFWGIMAFLSATIFLVTIWPFKAGSLFYSDGLRALRLLRGGPVAEADVAILSLMSYSMAGTRPADLPLSKAKAVIYTNPKTDVLHQYSINYYLYCEALETKKYDEAKGYLNALSNINRTITDPGVRSSVLIEEAFYEAYINQNPDKAARIMSDMKPSPLLTKLHLCMVKAAIALENNQPKECLALCEEGLAAKHKVIDAGTGRMHEDFIEDIKRKAGLM